MGKLSGEGTGKGRKAGGADRSQGRFFSSHTSPKAYPPPGFTQAGPTAGGVLSSNPVFSGYAVAVRATAAKEQWWDSPFPLFGAGCPRAGEGADAGPHPQAARPVVQAGRVWGPPAAASPRPRGSAKLGTRFISNTLDSLCSTAAAKLKKKKKKSKSNARQLRTRSERGVQERLQQGPYNQYKCWRES